MNINGGDHYMLSLINMQGLKDLTSKMESENLKSEEMRKNEATGFKEFIGWWY